MSDRWVVPWLFKVQAAGVNWWDEQGRLGYEGPLLDTGVDPGFLQLRWLLHPLLGLPREAFMVWRATPPAIMTTPQQLADELDWEPLESVGLPVDETWNDTGYALDEQGPLEAPLSPPDAALQRLQRGAPRLGWPPLSLAFDGQTASMPAWEPSDLYGYWKETRDNHLTQSLQAMLRALPNPYDHAGFIVQDSAAAGLIHLKPRLLGGPDDAVAARQPAQSEWHPLGLLALAVGSDPLASLLYGFGTALYSEPNALYMVTIRHHLTIGGQDFEFELADVIRLNPQSQPPDTPLGLSAGLLSRNHLSRLDAPILDNVGVHWERPANPVFSAEDHGAVYSVDAPITGLAASYCIGRIGPQWHQAEILLTRRAEEIGGWLPYVMSKPEHDGPVLFVDSLPRATTIGAQVIGDPLSRDYQYGVAAQDIFGRWSQWQTVGYQTANEPPQIPAILSVQLDPAGQLTVDVSWDWSERSPEFIELSGAFEDDPNTPLLAARLQFGGGDQTTAPAPVTVIPLDPDRAELNTWGAPQDRSPLQRGVRLYRLKSTLALNFAGRPKRVFQVRARGQCHLHHVMIPGWNVSPFGLPSQTTVVDPTPPGLPNLDVERPIWASLPDASGTCRAILRWPGEAGMQYVLYEATETALLDLLPNHAAGTDTAAPFTARLAAVRAAHLPRSRSAFRRVQQALIPAALPQTTFEVGLPPGSRIMHFYALTVMSPNQVESAWPDNTQFFAVAAPHLVVPFPPALTATPQPEAPAPTLRLRIEAPPGPAIGRVELYRTSLETLATDVDHMGPPIQVLAVNGPELVYDDPVTPSWRPYWYRAVAWSADDANTGAVGARSRPSPAVSAFVPPAAPPDLRALRVEQTAPGGQAALVSWVSAAPTFATPYGAHHVVLTAFDPAPAVAARFEQALGDIPQVAAPSPTPPADLAAGTISAVGNTYYAWLGRPVPGQPFSLAVKVIDPLGRISQAQIDVPDIQVLPVPVLSDIAVVTVDQDHYYDGDGLVIIGFQITSPMDSTLLAAYQLAFTVDYPDPMIDHPCRITQPLSAIPSGTDAEARQWVTAHEAAGVGLFRVIDGPDDASYRFFAWCFSAGYDYETGVMLTDPNGQSTSTSYKLG